MERFDEFEFEEYDRPFRDTDTGSLIRDLVIWNDKGQERDIYKGDVIHLKRASASYEILWIDKKNDYVRVNITEFNVNWLIRELIKDVKKNGHVIKSRANILEYKRYTLTFDISNKINIHLLTNYINKENFIEQLNELIKDWKELDILTFGDLYIRHEENIIKIELDIWIG